MKNIDSNFLPGRLFGGVEGGGTKFVCVLGRAPDEIVASATFPTSAPESTIERVASFFEGNSESPAAIGIGNFGPLDLRRGSPQYGSLVSTPKSDWSHFALLPALQKRLGCRVFLDYDTSVAARAEGLWGAGRESPSFVYLTVGTGIGGTLVLDRMLTETPLPPEYGHILIPKPPDDDFAGTCPYHGDCLEGLASGPAIAKRWGSLPERLPSNHPAWSLEARYLAAAISNYSFVLGVKRFIVGGGVMRHGKLHAAIGECLSAIRHLYLAEFGEIEVVAPELGGLAGALGALALGATSFSEG